jgi:beta-glucosidase
LNSQEENRLQVSENIDERVLHELYYPPFESAIQAGVGAMMCSYNKINGRYSCENNSTLNEDLRGKLGFKGWVMSDWGATHNISIDSGLDQEMAENLTLRDRPTFKHEDLAK